jgi:drug/metabolite transporter (DMT)-like permease
VCAGALLGFLVIGALERSLALDVPPTVWVLILILATVSTFGAFLAFLGALRVLGPVRMAIMSTIEPFMTAVIAAIVLAQPLTTTTLAGGALIAGAVVILATRGRGGA